MDFTLANFDFKVNTLTTVTEVDALLALQVLQIKEFEVKLSNNELLLNKWESRSGSIDAEIAEVQALIPGKESDLQVWWLVPANMRMPL